jgi:hypothetical protein
MIPIHLLDIWVRKLNIGTAAALMVEDLIQGYSTRPICFDYLRTSTEILILRS